MPDQPAFAAAVLHHVFVYGTLKRGGENHRFLAGQSFLGPARTGPGWQLYQIDGYPGLVAETADGTSRDLWYRRLEPTTAPADRGGQPFAVEVPAGVTVRLLTEPGPNANWDWSYWSRLQFTP